jgi:feruloyl-CoA synthase
MSKALREENSAKAAPYRPVNLSGRDFEIDRRPDGTIYMRSPHKLGAYPVKITERLEYWAKETPERTFMAQRGEDGEWRRVSYADALRAARSIGQWLLSRNLSVERPLAILSGNSLEHAVMGLAANYVGIPYVPISPAYALISEDFGKLRHIFKLLTPGLVFAQDGKAFARAIETIVPADMEVVVAKNPPANRVTSLFSAISDMEPTAAVDEAHDRIGPDTVTKILFTSGSTGLPKGVINTQRMWCSNQEMIAAQLRFFRDEPPVIVDWSPWHHTAGGNHNVGFIIYNGGTLYIDEGKPLPGHVETTVKNLREIACNWYFTVPKGFEALIPFFRKDAELRKIFFSKLKVLWFAGAALSQSTFDEMQELAEQTIGERVMFLTGLGATETAPMAIGRMWMSKDSTNMGLPAPGVELKLVPNGGKLEARLKGPNITPGYWRQPDLTAKAFDEEGYYKLGDALKFEDPNDPSLGLLFDGRVAEDFKLSSGTWVSVGPLRARLIGQFEPLARDVVIGGADQEEIAVLVFPVIDACRALAPELAKASPEDVVAHPAVLTAFRDKLNAFAKTSTGGSNRVCRAILLSEPPSLDAGEMTDKGSINQRAVLERRKTEVADLYAAQPSNRVIQIDRKK